MKNNVLLLLLLLSCACEKIRYKDFPEHEPQLTVNSLFGTDSLASVQLYASTAIGESVMFEGIEEATVQVWEDGQPAGQLYMQKSGYYQADTLYPKAGKSYTLRVSAPGYPTAEATTSLPTQPVVEDIQISRSPASTASQPLNRLKITLKDAPGQDYYLLKVYFIGAAYGFDEPVPYRQPFSMDFQAPIDEFYTPFGKAFADKTFDGTSYELVVDYEIYSDIETYIQISKANEDLYRYFKTYGEHSNYEEQTFSEPQEVYLNIDGGFGIFGGYTSLYYKYTPE
jgi:hypothetical protein